MNPITLLYSVATMAMAGPPMSATSRDSVQVPPPPVMNDSLVLAWHLAIVHFYDTLLVHPELQSMAGVIPMLSGVPNWDLERLECPQWRPINQDDSLGSLKAKPLFQQAGLATFPSDSVALAISQTPALAGAIQSALLTPGEFVAMTSGIAQARCANGFLRYFARWSGKGKGDSLVGGRRGEFVDPQNTLGKNLAYLYDKNYAGPTRATGMLEFWGKYLEWKSKMKDDKRHPDPDWYPKDKRMENFDGMEWYIDRKTGKEKPVPSEK